MLRILQSRLRQGHHTSTYPKSAPPLPDRYRGRPLITTSPCIGECRACSDLCPANALTIEQDGPIIDLGRCIMCGQCEKACQAERIQFSKDHRMAATKQEDFRIGTDAIFRKAHALEKRLLALFGRSLKLRQVSAGGCNACEADTNVLNTPVFDLARFGIQFVASPRHADGLLVTGPVTRNMELALRKTYDATPSPKIVIAVGACAISGGMFADHEETLGGVANVLPVDLYIPGCPPHPWTILDGLLRLTGRLKPDQ